MSWTDPAKVGSWFEAYGPRLVLYARQWVGGAAADDVVQDAFVSLIGCRRRPEHVEAWLVRAVRNAAISRLRSRKRRKHREAAVATETANAATWLVKKPDDLLDAEEVSRLVSGLPEGQREVVVLRIWGQLTLDAIAEVVGSSTATVFRRYQAGLEAIRHSLEQQREPSCQTNKTTR